MTDKIEGYLEVGSHDGEVIVNHPDLKPDEHGVGHIVFSPNQARNLARLLEKQATIAENWQRQQAEQRERERLEATVPPVDRSAQCLTDGSPITVDHRELKPDGQQKGYIVLTEAERGKGFVRPLRFSYVHIGKPPDGEKVEYPYTKVFPGGCGTRTTMGTAIAETYARCPDFYDGGTFCCNCGTHRPLEEFVWEGTNEIVGS